MNSGSYLNKMNTVKFIVVVSIALLSTDLIYHQVVNGQVPEHPNPLRELTMVYTLQKMKYSL
jgi:hypothetical protein